MWINRTKWRELLAYDDLKQEAIAHEAKNLILERENASARTTLDWLTMRVTQLEKERAQLLFMYTGVKVETPIIAQAPTSPIPQNVPLDAMPNFEDMGDEAAKKLGIGWDEDGRVKYATV